MDGMRIELDRGVPAAVDHIRSVLAAEDGPNPVSSMLALVQERLGELLASHVPQRSIEVWLYVSSGAVAVHIVDEQVRDWIEVTFPEGRRAAAPAADPGLHL